MLRSHWINVQVCPLLCSLESLRGSQQDQAPLPTAATCSFLVPFTVFPWFSVSVSTSSLCFLESPPNKLSPKSWLGVYQQVQQITYFWGHSVSSQSCTGAAGTSRNLPVRLLSPCSLFCWVSRCHCSELALHCMRLHLVTGWICSSVLVATAAKNWKAETQ